VDRTTAKESWPLTAYLLVRFIVLTVILVLAATWSFVSLDDAYDHNPPLADLRSVALWALAGLILLFITVSAGALLLRKRWAAWGAIVPDLALIGVGTYCVIEQISHVLRDLPLELDYILVVGFIYVVIPAIDTAIIIGAFRRKKPAAAESPDPAG